ncbi:hypothetical protein [Agarivorans sp. QJM3NY_25]|uniref:hypothetical protein n=1 Tax=Agarivorans sp. QJM3NY_25 TaxID=3421430 RepID=UPI003D7C39E8
MSDPKQAFSMLSSCIILLLATLLSPGDAKATIYQCGDNSFQQTPCASGHSQTIEVDPPQASSTPNAAAKNRGDLALQYKYRTAMIQHKIMPGMTKKQVLRSWGTPTKKNDSFLQGVSRSQWVYERGKNGSQNVYFKGERVTGWN